MIMHDETKLPEWAQAGIQRLRSENLRMRQTLEEREETSCYSGRWPLSKNEPDVRVFLDPQRDVTWELEGSEIRVRQSGPGTYRRHPGLYVYLGANPDRRLLTVLPASSNTLYIALVPRGDRDD